MTNGYNGRHIKENAFYIIPASDSIIPKNNNIIHMNKQWTMHFHFLNMNILLIYIHTKENIERERERRWRTERENRGRFIWSEKILNILKSNYHLSPFVKSTIELSAQQQSVSEAP